MERVEGGERVGRECRRWAESSATVCAAAARSKREDARMRPALIVVLPHTRALGRDKEESAWEAFEHSRAALRQPAPTLLPRCSAPTTDRSDGGLALLRCGEFNQRAAVVARVRRT